MKVKVVTGWESFYNCSLGAELASKFSAQHSLTQLISSCKYQFMRKEIGNYNTEVILTLPWQKQVQGHKS